MSLSNQEKLIKDSLSSVLLGYSVAMLNGQKVFIKHHGYCDSIETDFQYDIAYQNCIKNGIYTEEQKLKWAIDNKFWSPEEDTRIHFLRESIKDSNARKSKVLIPSQKKQITDSILENEAELSLLLDKRYSAFGVTAELLASQRSEDYYIFKSFFKDAPCLTPLFSDQDFDDIDDDLMQQLKATYFETLKFILNNNIRKIAISNSFLSFMYLTENPYEILGKPLSSYTFYQMDLISYGRLYKRILSSEPAPPESIKEDPDQLELWMQKTYSSKKLSETKSTNPDNSAKMIIGATTKDVKEIFGDENVVNVGDEIKKRGGMKMKDLMKLHGVG